MLAHADSAHKVNPGILSTLPFLPLSITFDVTDLDYFLGGEGTTTGGIILDPETKELFRFTFHVFVSTFS